MRKQQSALLNNNEETEKYSCIASLLEDLTIQIEWHKYLNI